ncbi:hypothetical protein Pfo_008052 [Paulownia fortunei]|nr:hypothetical protein Pfo_008052 [Paulownia fortunei]
MLWQPPGHMGSCLRPLLRLFPCLSDPARRSALSLKVALVMLHLVFAGVLFLFDNDLIEKTKQEPWYTAIYVLLFVATLIQYFVTSGTSPGYVLDAQKDVDERDASARRTLLASKQPASSKNGSVLITVDGRNYHRGNATAWTKLVMDLYPPGSSTRNLTCPYCNVVQPPRAKHCHDCDKCVLQFDHHCVWLGTCIGQGNHCRFCFDMFLFSSSLISMQQVSIGRPLLILLPDWVGFLNVFMKFACTEMFGHSLVECPISSQLPQTSFSYTYLIFFTF